MLSLSEVKRFVLFSFKLAEFGLYLPASNSFTLRPGSDAVLFMSRTELGTPVDSDVELY